MMSAVGVLAITSIHIAQRPSPYTYIHTYIRVVPTHISYLHVSIYLSDHDCAAVLCCAVLSIDGV